MITDLLAFVLVLVIAAMLLAPLESLYWWATRGAEEVDRDGKETSKIIAGKEVVASMMEREADDHERADRPDDGVPQRFLVYLSGIGAIGAHEVPEEEYPFVEDLKTHLPSFVVIDDVFPYAVDNRGLTAERMLGKVWKQLETIRMKNPNALLAALINLRNLMQLFVCADRRYGPTYNMGTAGEIYRSLVRHGHQEGSPDQVVLFGWSGGGQIALGAAWYLEALGLKVSVLSMGGMLSDDIALARIDHLWHLYGTEDGLQALGPKLFAGRWPVAASSPWNEAKRQGKITMLPLGPIHHNIKDHYFDRENTLPDGRTYSQTVIDAVSGILEHDLLPNGEPATTPM